MSAYGFSRY